MIEEELKQEIRDKLAAVASAIPGFRSRPAQRIMIAEVAKALAKSPAADSKSATVMPGQAMVVLQGGTGVGKSVAYSVAGLVMARARKKKLVIASSTVSLQEQLMERDLPMFLDAMGLDMTMGLAKGRTRYVCQYKLHQVLTDMQQLSMFDEGHPDIGVDAGHDGHLKATYLRLASELDEGKWNGDRDSQPGIDDETWRAVTSDRFSCLNRACPFFKSCAQMSARKKVKEAGIIVVNHDLLLADLAMGGGKILPAPAECFYVIDEAHGLPDKAVAAFASHHLVGMDKRGIEKLGHMVSTLQSTLGPGSNPACVRIREEAHRLASELADVQSFLASLTQLKPSVSCPRPTLEFGDSCLPDEFFEIGDNIKGLASSLLTLVEQCQGDLSDLLGTDRTKQALVEKLVSDLGAHFGRLEALNTTWRLFLEEPDEGAPPVAKWIEAVSFGKGRHDYQINASPVLADRYLKSMLWEKAAGVVLTSATITTLGSFDAFLKSAGLTSFDVPCIALPSPFDYQTQGLMEIPSFPNPKDYDAHTSALAERLIADMNKQGPEGMLVLFTSRRQLNDVASRIPDQLRPRVLLQGDQSKATIVAAHRTAIDNGRPSTIFGLASFSEGVDLPAKYCTHVVITKLPFASPDSPVLKSLSDWIESRGGNPFMEICVPDAARKLEQSVGRLIRTEMDHGQVVVTDPRLWNSRYGRAMLRGLPPFRLVAMGKEVTL